MHARVINNQRKNAVITSNAKFNEVIAATFHRTGLIFSMGLTYSTTRTSLQEIPALEFGVVPCSDVRATRSALARRRLAGRAGVMLSPAGPGPGLGPSGLPRACI